MIYDGFTFFNELQLLEVRLEELDPLIDKFIIVECPYTFTGVPKPLYFYENKSRYEKYLSKIIHIVADNPPNNGNAWDNEIYQRNCIKEGLGMANNKDIIIVGDLDEIPNIDVLQKTIENIKEKEDYVIMCKTFYHYINYYSLIWGGSKFSTIKIFQERFNGLADEFRRKGGRIQIHNGGWHFGYLGGPEKLKEKIKSFAHQEYNNEKDIHRMLENINKMLDVRDRKITKINIDNTFPKTIIKNLDKYKDWIGP